MGWKYNSKGESRSEIAKKYNFGKWMSGRKMSSEQKLRQSKTCKEKGIGLWMNGKHHSEETKKKIGLSNEGKIKKPFTEEHKNNISKSNKGIHHSFDTEFKIGDNSNERHFNWKGNNAGYTALHIWVRKHKYNFGFCETCGKITKKLDLTNINNHQYTRNPDDYQYNCRNCHRQIDLCENGI